MRVRNVVLLLLLSGPALLQGQAGASYDLIIRNARIVDGTASPRYRGAIAARGDRVVRIATRGGHTGDREDDADAQQVG